MRRVCSVVAAGCWSAAEQIAAVTLAWDDRQRRRLALTDDDGVPFLLDLPRAPQLKDGDGLRVDGGGIVAVRAAAEPVVDLYAADVQATITLAWHLGNRHAPMQLLADGGIRIRDDNVVASLPAGLIVRTEWRMAPFSPEPGAPASAHSGHHHGIGEPARG